jgi:hypothetical protein
MGVGDQRHAPAAFTPSKDPVPILQEAGWAPGPVWIGAENLAPLGFDTRTVQLVGSRYTDYATQPTNYYCATHNPIDILRSKQLRYL